MTPLFFLLRLSPLASQKQCSAWGGIGHGDRSHFTWVLTGGKRSAMLSELREQRRWWESEGEEWGGMELLSPAFFFEWCAAQLWWYIPAHVGLSLHRQSWKQYHRNVVEGRPNTQNTVYPSFKLQKRFHHLVKMTNVDDIKSIVCIIIR